MKDRGRVVVKVDLLGARGKGRVLIGWQLPSAISSRPLVGEGATEDSRVTMLHFHTRRNTVQLPKVPSHLHAQSWRPHDSRGSQAGQEQTSDDKVAAF